jgi:hypothetical protein
VLQRLCCTRFGPLTRRSRQDFVVWVLRSCYYGVFFIVTSSDSFEVGEGFWRIEVFDDPCDSLINGPRRNRSAVSYQSL